MADDNVNSDYTVDSSDPTNLNVNVSVNVDAGKSGNGPEIQDIKTVLENQAKATSEAQKSAQAQSAENAKNEKASRDSLGTVLNEIKNTLISLNSSAQNIAKAVGSSASGSSEASSSTSAKNPGALASAEDNELVAAFETKKFQTNYAYTLSEALKTTFADSAVQESLKKALSQGAEENASSSSDAGILDSQKTEIAALPNDELAKLAEKLQETIVSVGDKISEASSFGTEYLALMIEDVKKILKESNEAAEFNTEILDDSIGKLNESLKETKKNEKESTEKTAKASPERKGDETSKIAQAISESAEKNSEVAVETAKAKEEIDGLIIGGFADQMKVGNVKIEDWFEETEKFVNKILEENSAANGDVDQNLIDEIDKIVSDIEGQTTSLENESSEPTETSEGEDKKTEGEEEAEGDKEEAGDEEDEEASDEEGEEGEEEAEGDEEEEENTLEKTRNKSAAAKSKVPILERIVKSFISEPKSASSTIENIEKEKKTSKAQKDGESSPIVKKQNKLAKENPEGIFKEKLSMKGSSSSNAGFWKKLFVVCGKFNSLLSSISHHLEMLTYSYKLKNDEIKVSADEAEKRKQYEQKAEGKGSGESKSGSSGGELLGSIGNALKSLPGALIGALSKAKLKMIIQIVSIVAFLGYSIYKMFKNPELMKKIGNLIKTGAIKLFNFIKDFLNKASGIAIVVAGVVAAIAMMWIFGPYGLLVAGIATIMALMYRYREKIADFIIKIGQFLSKAWHNIMVKLRAVPDKFKEAMSKIWERIKGFFSSAAEKVKNFFLDFLSKIPIIGKYFKKQAQDEAADEAVKKAEADSMKAKAEEEQKSMSEKMDEEHLKAVQTPAVREPEPKAQTRTPEAESKTTYRQPASIERQASVKTDAPKTVARHDRLERRNDRRSATTEERRSNVKETSAREERRTERETRSDVARVERRSNVKETSAREERRTERETRSDVARVERRTDTSAEEKKVQKLSAEELKTKMITALLSKQVNFQKAGFVKQNVISKLLVAIAEMVKKLVELKSRDDPAKTAIELAKMAKAKAKETYNAAKDKVKSFFGFKKKEEPKAEQPIASEVTVSSIAPEVAKEAEIKAESKDAGVTPIVNPDSISSYVNKVDESNASSTTTNIDASKSVASNIGIETTVSTDSSSIVTNAAVVNENIENMKREAAISAAQSAESASELENEEESSGPDYTKLVNALPLAIAQGLATYFTNRHIKLTTDDGEDALEVEADDTPTAI